MAEPFYVLKPLQDLAIHKSVVIPNHLGRATDYIFTLYN